MTFFAACRRLWTRDRLSGERKEPGQAKADARDQIESLCVVVIQKVGVLWENLSLYAVWGDRFFQVMGDAVKSQAKQKSKVIGKNFGGPTLGLKKGRKTSVEQRRSKFPSN